MMSSSATSAAAFAAAMARAGQFQSVHAPATATAREGSLDPRRVRGQAQVLAASACA
jgi:hypothetical protein